MTKNKKTAFMIGALLMVLVVAGYVNAKGVAGLPLVVYCPNGSWSSTLLNSNFDRGQSLQEIVNAHLGTLRKQDCQGLMLMPFGSMVLESEVMDPGRNSVESFAARLADLENKFRRGQRIAGEVLPVELEQIVPPGELRNYSYGLGSDHGELLKRLLKLHDQGVAIVVVLYSDGANELFDPTEIKAVLPQLFTKTPFRVLMVGVSQSPCPWSPGDSYLDWWVDAFRQAGGVDLALHPNARHGFSVTDTVNINDSLLCNGSQEVRP